MWPDELSLNLFSYLFSEIFFWNQCQSRISSCYACSSLLKIFRAFSDSYSSRLPAVCKHLQHSRNRHKDKAAHWREEIVPVVSWQCLLLSEQWIVCVKLNQCDPLKSHMNTHDSHVSFTLAFLSIIRWSVPSDVLYFTCDHTVLT